MDKEKLTDVPGVGFIVVVAPGSKDTRERPYTYENVVTDGRKETERTYEVRRVDNGELVVSLAGEGATKDAAIKAAKEVMSDIKADLDIEVVYRVKDGKSVVGHLKTKPSPFYIYGNRTRLQKCLRYVITISFHRPKSIIKM